MAKRPHKNLIVWQESMALVKEIYRITESFPPKEVYGITSQLRRAAVSVPVNISEGAARKSKREFVQFLHISDGSLSEVDTLLEIALMLNMISKEDFENCNIKMEKINALLKGLIRQSNEVMKSGNKAISE